MQNSPPFNPEKHIELVFTLTDTQKDVLKQIAQCYSTKEIASNRQCSTKTIEYHRICLCKKLKVASAPELIRIAVETGLV